MRKELSLILVITLLLLGKQTPAFTPEIFFEGEFVADEPCHKSYIIEMSDEFMITYNNTAQHIYVNQTFGDPGYFDALLIINESISLPENATVDDYRSMDRSNIYYLYSFASWEKESIYLMSDINMNSSTPNIWKFVIFYYRYEHVAFRFWFETTEISAPGISYLGITNLSPSSDSVDSTIVVQATLSVIIPVIAIFSIETLRRKNYRK